MTWAFQRKLRERYGNLKIYANETLPVVRAFADALSER